MTGWTVTLTNHVADQVIRYINNHREGQAFLASDGTTRLSQEAFDFLADQRPGSEFSLGGTSGPPEEFDLYIYDAGYPLRRIG